ncbi:MAG: SDR family oxidoreductase [Rhizobiaceae bacterium]
MSAFEGELIVVRLLPYGIMAPKQAGCPVGVMNLLETCRNRLSGTVAIVTGASKGIGAAISGALAANGVKVLCFARTGADVEAVATQINAAGGTAIAHAGDATCPDDIASAVEKIESEFGELHIAFLNAGGDVYQSSIVDSDVSLWSRGIETNLHSVFYGIRAVAPLMIRSKGGRIILTGSAMGHYPQADHSNYCVGKAGARLVARTAALELAAFNISVNEFIPGPTETEQALLAAAGKVDSPFKNPNEWVKKPEDVVPLALLLAGYPGAGPTGQVFSLARR